MDCGAGITQGAKGHRLRCDGCNVAKFGRGWRRPFAASTHQCLTCQRMFEKSARGPSPMYCSSDCRRWWAEFDKRARRTIGMWASGRECKVCESLLYPRGSGNPILSVQAGNGQEVYCSKPCRQFDIGERNVIHDRCSVPWRECVDCGAEFVGYWQRYKPLCERCKVAHLKDHWRRKNTARRAARKSGDAFALADIAKRDGYRCHLCNRKVDMSLSGDHKQGPTIDHLVPISKGGEDVESNVALAHRSCNCARGNRGTVQLRLAA